MTQPAAQSSTTVQQEPTGATSALAAPAKNQAGGLTFGWRITLYLWAAAFVSLLAYELLNMLVRLIGRLL